MTGEKQTQWFLTFNRCRHHQLSSLTRELSWISLPHAVKLGSAMSDTDRDAGETGVSLAPLAGSPERNNGMQVLHPRCCGLDIHKKTVVACVLLTDPDGTIHRFVRTFGTMTAELLALADWLNLHEVTHVAMESTGVLWRPVFNVLEEGRTLLLVNAQHVKAVPGQ